MLIRTLPVVVPAPPDRPRRPGAAQTSARSRRLAANPELEWNAAAARDVIATYARLAPVWESERGSYRPVPMRDALARGGPFEPGLCVEVGAGTGVLTPLLREVWPQVLSIDLSPDMLSRSEAPWRVLADAARLPVGAGTAAVVLGDAPLFAAEVCRVLGPAGCVVWSNALGDAAPHHVPVEEVRAALSAAAGRPWHAVTSQAGWGRWAVLRRAPIEEAGADA